MQSPVLFIVFNRPETTRLVFEAIRLARPPKLYVAADGPRVERKAEEQICLEVRRIATAVDWPCEVRTLFRSSNLGCKLGVSSGIDWFFSHEPEGIILEDDVLPMPTFFEFCEELLGRYRDDGRVSMIAGCNLVSNSFHADESYIFSHYCNIWGWAGWRRSWQHYDVAMTEWPAWRDAGGLAKISGGKPLFESYWRRILDNVHRGEIDTWDYQWLFACWRMNGLVILPGINQIRNLGFGADATHTKTEAPKVVLELRAAPIKFPLIHPETVVRNYSVDQSIGSKMFGINIKNAVIGRLLRIPIFGNAVHRLRTLVKNAVS
jgi:hypothetical protein